MADEKKRVVTLCGVQGCCPTATIDNETRTLEITDDAGGKVTLTEAEWRDALAKVQFDQQA